MVSLEQRSLQAGLTHLDDEHEVVVGSVQELDAELLQKEADRQRRASFGVDVDGRLAVLRHLHGTLLFVEVDLSMRRKEKSH